MTLPLTTQGQKPQQADGSRDIKDSKDPKNHGIILISQKAMQEVFEKSGPLAKSCEFQTHYWFLNLRYKGDDDSILDIAIPTIYFNYPQKVSGARIDFEMKDVSDTSAKVLPIHFMKVNELLKTGLIENLEAYFNVKFETMSVDVGSIHRHPGSSKHQSFSGTDLCVTAKDHGVVYPFGTAFNNKPNFAGIMALDSGQCKVAHYEYRIANGTLGTDISYVKGRCAAIMVNDKESTLSKVEQLFKPAEEPFEVKENFSLVSDSSLEVLSNMFLETNFSPFTDTVNGGYLTSAPIVQRVTAQFDWSNYLNKNKKKADPTNKPTGFDVGKLPSMNKDILCTHLKELDLYYYERIEEEDYKELTKQEIIDNILEMYVLITEEENEVLETINYELDKMKEDLIAYGVAPSVLAVASEENIRKWHANSNI